MWQPVAIRYPDAELVTTGLLRTLLAAEGEPGVWVGRKLPPTRPPRAVQLVRDGGPEQSLRDIARMRVLVWGEDDQDVNDLSRLVAALFPRMVGQSGVLKTERISGPFEVPDAAPKRQMSIEVHLRGEAL